jgi:predicted MFS family arabinose efflux permease
MNNDRMAVNAGLRTAGAVKRARKATSLYFFAGGIGISSWAPLIPLAKSRLGLDDAALGILLLFFGIGAIVVMPLAPKFIVRAGLGRATLISGVLMAVSLPALLCLSSFPAMVVGLLIFGGSTGLLDVALNQQAVLIQDACGRRLLSGFHGLSSLGGILGALAFGLLQHMGLSAVPAICSVSCLLIVTMVSQYFNLFQKGIERRARGGVRFPGGPALLLGLMAFVIALTDGAVLDWGAILLQDYRRFDPSFSGLGFSLYSVAMAAMRLEGDRIVDRIGPGKVVLYGGMLVTSGLWVLVTIPDGRASLLGFVLMGLGCANIIPIFFTAAGRIQRGAAGFALPAVIAMTYAGALSGPALIGLGARVFTLPGTMGLAAFFVILAVVGFTLKNFK